MKKYIYNFHTSISPNIDFIKVFFYIAVQYIGNNLAYLYYIDNIVTDIALYYIDNIVIDIALYYIDNIVIDIALYYIDNIVTDIALYYIDNIVIDIALYYIDNIVQILPCTILAIYL